MAHERSPGLPFIKMHGLGNDFVVLDLRSGGTLPDAALTRAIAAAWPSATR